MPRSPAEALEPMRPPEPPERDEPEPDPHPFLRMLDWCSTFFFLLACLSVGVFYWVKVQFDQPGPLATSTVIVIPKARASRHCRAARARRRDRRPAHLHDQHPLLYVFEGRGQPEGRRIRVPK